MMNRRLSFQLLFTLLVVYFLGHTFYSVFYHPENGSRQELVGEKTGMAITNASVGKEEKHDPDSIMDQVDQVLSHVPGDHNRAIDLLDHIILHHPEHHYAIRLKANLFGQVKRHSDSVKTHMKYLQFNPGDVRSRLSLGKQLVILKRWPEAIAEFERVHKAYPFYSPVCDLLARAYRAVGNQEKASEMEKIFQHLETTQTGKSLPLVIHPKYIYRKQEKPGHP